MRPWITGNIHSPLRGAGLWMTDGNKVLLLRRSPKLEDATGTWCTPGGHIDDGESPLQAARRECKEEIGWVPPFRPGVMKVLRDYGLISASIPPEYIGRPPRLNWEHDDYVWADLKWVEENFGKLHWGIQSYVRWLKEERSKTSRLDRSKIVFMGSVK